MKRVTLILLALGALIALGVFISIVGHGFSELAEAEEEKERRQYQYPCCKAWRV